MAIYRPWDFEVSSLSFDTSDHLMGVVGRWSVTEDNPGGDYAGHVVRSEGEWIRDTCDRDGMASETIENIVTDSLEKLATFCQIGDELHVPFGSGNESAKFVRIA